VGERNSGGWHQGGVSAMKLRRRQFLRLAAGAAALPAVSRIARAQTYPARPVRIIVGFAAGSTTDIFARLIGQWLSERLGRPFIIENRPGAGSNIGTAAVVNAPPDGYTLLMIASSNVIATQLYDNLTFNFTRDIAPVGGTNSNPYVMVVSPSLPARSVPEFIAYAKANPGKINMGSNGVGTTLHLSGELFKMMTGVNMVHVPRDWPSWRRRAAGIGCDFDVALANDAGRADIERIRTRL
jgi:tripartite-type tricarboxylate transporter receptor subunit TctC